VKKEEPSSMLFLQSYSSDNGVMIAYTGLLAYKKGLDNPFEDLVRPRWRIDEVKWFI